MTTTSAPGQTMTTDPRPHFFSAARTACETVQAVSADQLPLPTPCTDYDVRTLLGHLVAVFRRVTSVAAGIPAVGHAPLVTGVPDEGWGAAARAALRELEQAWADPAVLRREMVLPFGTLPGAAALASYTGEVLTHTWDLAVSTRRWPDWDDAVVSGALAAVRSKLPTAERPPGVPFADAVPVPDDAPVIDRLVAWQGRDPRWRPAV
jgi:uncharacterized protein (TIGR03086 family)